MTICDAFHATVKACEVRFGPAEAGYRQRIDTLHSPGKRVSHALAAPRQHHPASPFAAQILAIHPDCRWPSPSVLACR